MRKVRERIEMNSRNISRSRTILTRSTSQQARRSSSTCKRQRQSGNEHRWPNLAKMVKQYFASPASTGGVHDNCRAQVGKFSAAGRNPRMHGAMGTCRNLQRLKPCSILYICCISARSRVSGVYSRDRGSDVVTFVILA